MLSAIAIGVFILGLIAGWKLRGFWNKRPRILGGKPESAASPDGNPTGGTGVLEVPFLGWFLGLAAGGAAVVGWSWKTARRRNP